MQKKIKILNNSKHPLPQYATLGSAGLDLRANLENAVDLPVGRRALIPTGLYIQLPDGYEAQIRPRSGLAIKHGITVLNSPGTIDSDYLGEIGIIVANLGEDDFTINDGDRIAQMVISRYEKAEFDLIGSSDEFTQTERSQGGFGHSGVK